MLYRRMPIEVESPEELGYSTIECNLAESSIWDARFGEWSEGLEDLVLCYGEHRGKLALRETVAQRNRVDANDVLVVPGAAAGLFIVNTSLLETGTSLLVVRPNYTTNIEVPRLLPCRVQYIDLRFENNFALGLDALADRVTASTAMISVTYPHNPTGTVISENELDALIEFVESKGCYLLVDETYRDLHHRAAPSPAASLSKNVISVSSLSKAFGLPGIRMGWIVCRNAKVMDLFLAAKEQIFICNSVLDEEIALRCLQKSDTLLSEISQRVLSNLKLVANWMQREQRLEWVQPGGGVVCLPRIKAECSLDTKAFYKILLSKHSTYVGPGHWFDLDDRYFRLGFGWESPGNIALGLANISKALDEAGTSNDVRSTQGLAPPQVGFQK